MSQKPEQESLWKEDAYKAFDDSICGSAPSKRNAILTHEKSSHSRGVVIVNFERLIRVTQIRLPADALDDRSR